MKLSSTNRKCAALLKKINSEVNAGDRKAAMKQFSVSYVTIGRYLKGQVANLEFGFQLQAFLRKRLRKRLTAMKQAIKEWEGG
jgi:hypothetical protein